MTKVAITFKVTAFFDQTIQAEAPNGLGSYPQMPTLANTVPFIADALKAAGLEAYVEGVDHLAAALTTR